MIVDRISQWVGVLANIGVLLGFLVIAYQLQLNRDSMQQASNQQSSSLGTSAEVALMGDTGYAAYAKSIVSPSELTHEELVQFWTYMSIAQLNAQQAFIDYSEGRISKQGWFSARDTFVFYFNYPMGRVWFEESKRVAEGTELSAFYESAQEALDRVPIDQTSKWFFRELPQHWREEALSS